jgi:hypothetical protein
LVGAVPPVPRLVAQEHRPRGRRKIFTWKKVPAQQRGNPQSAEETIAHLSARHVFNACSCLQKELVLPVNIQRDECVALALPLGVITVGDVVARSDRQGFKKSHQTRRLLIRQRSQQRSVYKGKDGRACTDTQTEHAHCGSGENGTLAQLTQRKTEVLDSGFEQGSDQRSRSAYHRGYALQIRLLWG